jgi:hypothetical protein
MKLNFKVTSIALASLLTAANTIAAGLLTVKPAQAESVQYCGPANNPKVANLVRFFLFPYVKTFNPACKNHDKCYEELRSNGKTREICDLEFKRDLYKQCENRSLSQKISQDIFGVITNPKLGIGLTRPCKSQADYAYWFVSGIGEWPLGDAGQSLYSLKVVKVEANRIKDRFSDDELKVCVTLRNDGNLATEWDLVLLDKKGGIVDTEPDTYERNIKVGQTDKECVSTRGTTSSISDLGTNAQVVIRIDDSLGPGAFYPIAKVAVNTNRPKDKFTAVPYNEPSRREAYEEIVKAKPPKP